MSFEDNKPKIEDQQVEEALRNFRASVHVWSDNEFARPRQPQSRSQSAWRHLLQIVTGPVTSWSLAALLLVSGVTVPVALHHQQQLAAAQQAAVREQQRMAAVASEQQLASAISDEELLRHVDSDIARATPDAMEPLASMMSDSTSK